MKAWHFVGDTLRNGDPIPPDGKWLEYSGPVKICESGLHASKHPFDALQYSLGNTLCLVDVDDVVEEESDKLVCRKRKIIKRMDFENQLRAFARQQALKVLHLWDVPEIVKRYLETGDESIRDKAWASAWVAARVTSARSAGAAGEVAVAAAARDEFKHLVNGEFDVQTGSAGTEENKR